MEGLFLGHHVLVSCRNNNLQWRIDLEENCQVTPQGRLLPPWTDAISWPGCQRSRANIAAYLSLGETWWPGIAHCAPHAGSGPGLQPLSSWFFGTHFFSLEGKFLNPFGLSKTKATGFFWGWVGGSGGWWGSGLLPGGQPVMWARWHARLWPLAAQLTVFMGENQNQMGAPPRTLRRASGWVSTVYTLWGHLDHGGDQWRVEKLACCSLSAGRA